MSPTYTRRHVLAWGLAGTATLLAACSDSPGDGDPTLTAGPDEPTENPTDLVAGDLEVADLDWLMAAWADAHLLAQQVAAITEAEGAQADLLADAGAALTEQAEVLGRLLTAGGVELPDPPEFVDDSGSGTSDSDTGDSGTSTAVPDAADTTSAPGLDEDDNNDDDDDEEEERAERARLARVAEQVSALAAACAEALSPDALAELAEVSAVNLATATSVTGQRGGVAKLLGSEPQGQRGPIEGPRDAVAADLVDVFRPAVYAFEVLAARTALENRSTYEDPLQILRRHTRRLIELAGTAASPPPLGYAITHDLDDSQGRAALARSVLTPLLPAIMAEAGTHHRAPESVSGTVHLLVDVIGLSRRWVSELEPFPGMSLPESR